MQRGWWYACVVGTLMTRVQYLTEVARTRDVLARASERALRSERQKHALMPRAVIRGIKRAGNMRW